MEHDCFRKLDGTVCIEWNIKNFSSNYEKQSRYLLSPTIQMKGATWGLTLLLTSHVHARLCIINKPETKKRCVKYHIMLQINENEIFGNYRVRYMFDDTPRYDAPVVQMVELLRRMSSDTLTVLCFIRLEVEDQGPSTEVENLNTKNEGVDILSSNMKDLFHKGENHDFVIKVKDRDFQVHKTILSARSPVFSAMFHSDMAEKRSGITEIEDCEPDVFERFLLYLYSGQVEGVSWENATHLYTLGDKYDLPHLRKQCLQFMKGNLTIEVFCDAISLAVKHKESGLVESSEEFFLKNVKSILVTNKWQLLMTENPVICNELFLKCYK